MFEKYMPSWLSVIFCSAMICAIIGIASASQSEDYDKVNSGLEYIEPELNTFPVLADSRQDGKINCNEEKYSDLCYSEISILSTKKSLTLEQSERCLAIGLVIKRSGKELDKQTAYMNIREGVLKQKIKEAESGNLSREEALDLIAEVNRFDKQVSWINGVIIKLKKLGAIIDECKGSEIHDDSLDSRVEAIANVEYNKIWK
jgi:hypothetical protein